MTLRPATTADAPAIWAILQDAIAARKRDGSQQWQNGYPNPDSIAEDIANAHGFVATDTHDTIIAYAAIIFGIEPAYDAIDGQWLTNGEYVVLHRVATADSMKGQGIATRLFIAVEELAHQRGVFSIKVDTNFDNIPMLKLLDRLGYTYCGEVFLSGAPRKAFEKVLPHY